MARGRSRGRSKSKGSNKGVAIDLSTDFPGDVKFAVGDLTDDQVFFNAKNVILKNSF